MFVFPTLTGKEYERIYRLMHDTMQRNPQSIHAQCHLQLELGPMQVASLRSASYRRSARCSQCDLGLDIALFWLDNCHRTGHFGSSLAAKKRLKHTLQRHSQSPLILLVYSCPLKPRLFESNGQSQWPSRLHR